MFVLFKKSIHAQLKAAKSVVSNKKKAESTFRQAALSKNSAFTSILHHQSAKWTASWLTTLPIANLGFVMNKRKFQDALFLRYDMDVHCTWYVEILCLQKETSSNDENDNENIPPIMIGATEIKRVSEIKFLGVVIDKKLSWDAHVKSLTKKLASCTGSINRFAASIPKTLYMNLYYTLFESYITYGITVWGSIPNREFNKLFNAQKKILRVLFCDKEKFLDKFRTCIRARPYPEQNLPTEFYVKEHSKPLFNKK